MSEPKAPKDPEKFRPYFYIIRDKDIFGSKQNNGQGIQFIYQNDGRLINSAQIVGNIEDSNILNKLKTVEGFKEVIHSIGISVEMENSTQDIEFVFQMYGKNDIYGGGTNITALCSTSGSETRVNLSDIRWKDDDNEPGQIKFIFKDPELIAKASVRFFLNDGFNAPDVSEESSVNVESSEYKEMIKKSLMSMGNSYRLLSAIKKAKAGKDVIISYIGGSITQGAGAIPINNACYAYKSYNNFANRFEKQGNVHFIKAGVGGTPSELGMIRFDRDVIRDGLNPDIVVVEFAVNDYGDETNGDCYESLVRKILELPNNPGVILLFSVFANDENLQTRLSPIGKHYNLPMVSVKDAVTPQFKLKKEEGRVLSKNQFFYDIYHPQNIGHTIMADCLTYLFDKTAELLGDNSISDTTFDLLKQKPIIGNTFEKVKLLDRIEIFNKSSIDCGGFCETDTNLQCVEMDTLLHQTPQFPYNWMFDGEKTDVRNFKMEITCKALVMVFKDSGETDAGRAEVVVDGKHILTADPKQNGWTHCNPVIIINEQKSSSHSVVINIAKGDEKKKFTILGFGYVE